MKKLLRLTALLEAGTGLGLLTVPALVVRILLGASLDPTAGTAVGRVAGAAVLALSVACWAARDAGSGKATAGIVAAMLLYNLVVAALLIHVRFGPGLSGPGLWPVVALHGVLGVLVHGLFATCTGAHGPGPDREERANLP